MAADSTNSAIAGSRATRLVLLFAAVSFSLTWRCGGAEPGGELVDGFKATPESSVSSFQPLLTDPTGNFSLGFLRVNATGLALAVLHRASTEPFWVANRGQLARWSDETQLSFNGSLVISDPRSKVFWSTQTEGQRVVLLNDSNLVVQSRNGSVQWQSFGFPTDTLVSNQNFTSEMELVSSNAVYSMRLGDDFIGLYATFRANSRQMYWKHKALQAKARVVPGKGPVYIRVEPDGFLGMYQTGKTPVDIEAFNSFNRRIDSLLILRLEPDGNLKGYLWDGTTWVANYQAITDSCQLPDACGPYGLCTPGSGCSCINNATDYGTEGCRAGSDAGDLCGGNSMVGHEFEVMRRAGVETQSKEFTRYVTAPSVERCEALCEKNCTCWGAVYHNGTGFCYILDYPIRTLMGVGDESKMGYFKVRPAREKKKMGLGSRIGIGVLCVAIVVVVGILGLGGYKVWKRKRGVKTMLDQDSGVSPAPYKNLESASFRSIEMSHR